jgi:hypothetical protein
VRRSVRLHGFILQHTATFSNFEETCLPRQGTCYVAGLLDPQYVIARLSLCRSTVYSQPASDKMLYALYRIAAAVKHNHIQNV